MKEDETIEHEGKVFEKIQWLDAVVSGRTFVKCTFSKCQFNGLSFLECSFTDCTFEDCDLSLMKVKGSYFTRLQVNRCKAIGIHWFDVGKPFTIQFTDSNISYSSFFGKPLKKTKFKNCVAKEVDFSECILSEADFGGTDLEGARFIDCDLSLANFKEARNYHIDIQHNKVKKTKFSLPEALRLLDAFDVVID